MRLKNEIQTINDYLHANPFRIIAIPRRAICKVRELAYNRACD